MPDKDEKKPEEKPSLPKGHRDGANKAEGKEEIPAPKDNLVVTQNKVRIGGREIKYTVTAGTMVLKEEPADREKVWPWSYSAFENQYLNVAETMRKAMTYNPHLKVFVANGIMILARLILQQSIRSPISGWTRVCIRT